jgi:hypothetical protein
MASTPALKLGSTLALKPGIEAALIVYSAVAPPAVDLTIKARKNRN